MLKTEPLQTSTTATALNKRQDSFQELFLHTVVTATAILTEYLPAYADSAGFATLGCREHFPYVARSNLSALLQRHAQSLQQYRT